ncbi:hypothetical protein AJR19_001100, partial [Shigella dysenteriae]|uniref:DUF2655 domain-containing protein n=1 Tax=Shigella dysenteriae TaxID=622 RepID=UPI0009911089
MSVARFSCGKTAQLSKKQTGYYSPEIFPSAGKDCNPQPANCLKDQYVLRHCCVDDRSGKMGYSVKFLVLTRMDTETASLFHCKPCYSKMTFTIYHPLTHSFLYERIP